MDITSRNFRPDTLFLAFTQTYHRKKGLGHSLKTQATALCVPMVMLSKESLVKAAKVTQVQDHRLQFRRSPHPAISLAPLRLQHGALTLCMDMPMRMAASLCLLHQQAPQPGKSFQ